MLTLAAHGKSVFAEPAPAVLITDPLVLTTVERDAGDFSRRLSGKAAAVRQNAWLWQNRPGYRDIVHSLTRDLDRIRAADPLLSVTMARSHRLFDVRWLRSPAAYFELAGIVNRLDRRPFHPRACGELRLIYRLKYSTRWRGARVTSRLPFTVNIVTWIYDGGGGLNCAAIARRWRMPPHIRGSALGRWLTSGAGPLASPFLVYGRLKSVEVNLQSVRWPSTVRPDLGAHAEYLLRVFEPGAGVGRFVLGALENTPDVQRIRADRSLRRALLRWLRDPANLKRIDLGVAALPRRFLARKATSVAPLGLSRLANRPFSRIFEAKAFADLDLGGGRFVRSPAALLRRLDDLSCVGCHQARSVAGFHLLGVDRADTARGNAIAVSGSPHLHGDLPRRQRYVRQLAGGAEPDLARPFSDRAEIGEGGYGSHCGLGDPGFDDWSCATGFRCRSLGAPLGDRTVGQCFPSGQAQVGDPCEPGRLRQHADPHRDRLVRAEPLSCAPGDICEATRVGSPGGMCASACEADAVGTCGSIALLNGFNRCLANRQPFTRCLTQNVRPAGLRRCDDSTPCRDDYLCARTATGVGACIPPYFLFQMRVEGHPPPPRR